MSQELIHHLIAFPTCYFTATAKANEIHEMTNKEKRKRAWKKFRKSKLWCEYTTNGVYRGSWMNKDELIERIKNATDVYDICEGWYDYLLIETHSLNCIDGCRFDPPSFTESEKWFQFIKLGEEDGIGQYEYQAIERPECLQGLHGFL